MTSERNCVLYDIDTPLELSFYTKRSLLKGIHIAIFAYNASFLLTAIDSVDFFIVDKHLKMHFFYEPAANDLHTPQFFHSEKYRTGGSRKDD